MRFLYISSAKIGEFRLQEDMRSHHMECVTMRKRGNRFLSLVVPGLAERRPSLVQGDYIFAKLASEFGNDTAKSYQVCCLLIHGTSFFLMIMIRKFSFCISNF